MIFYGFCFYITLALDNLSVLSKRLKKGVIILLVILISIHFFSLQKLYKNWISNGRSALFIKETEKFFYTYFSKPINKDTFVFLDFDNSQTLYYIQYGLDFKLLVLTKTFNQNHFPNVLIDKNSLHQTIEKAVLGERNSLIDNTFSFSFKNGVFSDSNHTLRLELEKWKK